MIASNENTFYCPGDSFLHRSDPRLKLCICVLFVVFSFAASSWLELLAPLLFLVVALGLIAPVPTSFWRVCWMLRWLLLFTVLMHLLFTDGRTLMGVSWLSLDGLYNGLLVSVQMLLSVIAAALLSLTTPVDELVAAFGWVVSPFRWLGCKTDEWQKTLLLTIHFVPVVRDEMSSVDKMNEGESEGETGHPSRWQHLGNVFKSFVDGLISRGDKVAHELILGNTLEELHSLPALLPLTLQDRLLLGGGFFMMCLSWLVSL